MAIESEHAVEMLGGDASTELSSNRTAMSFERTRMSSDRTLMSVVRTSISLVGFGFTIFQFFHALNEKFLKTGLPPAAPRYFGAALIFLGVVLLVCGLINHRQETVERRGRRERLFGLGLIHHPEIRRVSSAQVIAFLFLVVALLALASVAVRSAPF
jgi:inner membrane protein YidH